ncbi:MAG: 50S ribosomal protein L4 [Candidatus Thermoplasmatota archaeon]|nr:50S ribosomal protein L4 [Candidatus Thermoplasmatota archaeon]
MAATRTTGGKAKKAVSRIGTVNVYGTDGKVKGKMELPGVFSTPFRPDLIRRAVVSAQANRRQRYGPSKVAGMRHSVSTWGKGRGVARVQRLTQGRTAAESPNNVGGRRAHPPRPEHSFRKKINDKERRFAVASALAATSSIEMVRSRGHKFREGLTLPVIVDDPMENMEKTKDVLSMLDSLGLSLDITRAYDGKHIRAGKGKMRGRRYRQPRSILFVATEGSPILTGARNLPGVNTIGPSGINAELLAPGGDPGRLLVFSKRAFEKIGGGEG